LLKQIGYLAQAPGGGTVRLGNQNGLTGIGQGGKLRLEGDAAQKRSADLVGQPLTPTR
jgi:hypothetical protein